MKQIIAFDKWLFVKINEEGTNHFFDVIMPWLRKPLFWLPLYIALAIFAVVKFKRRAIAWIVTVGAFTGISDLISSHVIKPSVGRLRPCNTADIIPHIHMLAAYCGQNGSFTSSHASNHFTMAMFFYLTLKHIIGNWGLLFFLWAAVICYAQVYVGVHFPADVAGGAVLGCMLGYIASKFLTKYFPVNG